MNKHIADSNKYLVEEYLHQLEMKQLLERLKEIRSEQEKLEDEYNFIAKYIWGLIPEPNKDGERYKITVGNETIAEANSLEEAANIINMIQTEEEIKLNKQKGKR